MNKPKFTWSNFKKDRWLHIQLAAVVVTAIAYIILA